MYFVSHNLFNGRRFRALTVEDYASSPYGEISEGGEGVSSVMEILCELSNRQPNRIQPDNALIESFNASLRNE